MLTIILRPVILAAALAGVGSAAFAKDKPPASVQTVSPAMPLEQPIPPANEATAPAKELFGAKTTPSAGPASSIGFYARGCLAGGKALPIDGPHWQVMRLSRNRNWGHPNLVRMIEHLANSLPKVGGWNGILVGDMSQPRGGPMVNGHASHQVGLDVDIWITPFPDRTLSREERENMPPMNVVAKDGKEVTSEFSPQHIALIKAASEETQVERIFVNPAIKQTLCRNIHGDRSWLHKVRPYWGHDDHIHVRIACPPGHAECRHQDPIPAGDGCDASLAWWFRHIPHGPVTPPKPRPPLKLAALPAACKAVLNAP